jgi:hypothetical protein
MVAARDVDLAAARDTRRDQLIAFDQRRMVLVADNDDRGRLYLAEPVKRWRPFLLPPLPGRFPL